MSISDRRLRSAIRLTPHGERARYAEEWERDLREAERSGSGSGSGTRARDVIRGARAVALRRRARWAGQVLLGRKGMGAAAAAWLVILVLLTLAFLGGGVFGGVGAATAALAVAALMFAGRPSALTHWLMIASAAIVVASAAYVWWALGVQLDAADTFTPIPGAATHGGAALVAFGLSVLVFVASAVVGYLRRPH